MFAYLEGDENLSFTGSICDCGEQNEQYRNGFLTWLGIEIVEAEAKETRYRVENSQGSEESRGTTFFKAHSYELTTRWPCVQQGLRLNCRCSNVLDFRLSKRDSTMVELMRVRCRRIQGNGDDMAERMRGHIADFTFGRHQNLMGGSNGFLRHPWRGYHHMFCRVARRPGYGLLEAHYRLI